MNKKEQLDNSMEVKRWQHPTDTITGMIEDTEEKSLLQIFTYNIHLLAPELFF